MRVSHCNDSRNYVSANQLEQLWDRDERFWGKLWARGKMRIGPAMNSMAVHGSIELFSTQ